MRPLLPSITLVFITSLVSSCTALEALSGSPCAAQCGNVLGNTTGADIVCQNGDFTATSAGITFSNCITCQLGSNYVDPTTKQTDLQWALYNLRYAVSWCLFGLPDNPNVGDTPCITSTACGPLESAFDFDSLSPNASSYSYCALMNSIALPKCSACLQVQSNEFYITNFVTALQAACQQQPTPGNTISIKGSLFSTTLTNITSSSTTPTGSSSVSTRGLTLGAKVGIAVGGIVFLLGLTGFCIVFHGRRRRRNFLRERLAATDYEDWRINHAFHDGNSNPNMTGAGGEPSQRMSQNKDIAPSPGGFFDSPDSQRPLQPWAGRMGEDSPMSANGEKVYFSPYSSQYTSPVSAVDVIATKGREWPIDRKGSFSRQEWPVDRKGSLGGRFGSRSRSRDGKEKEKEGDKIEMQNVAPVLLHPGHGRGGSVALTEEDVRRGEAL